MKNSAVLFVCTGNICRSPTAEGVFRHLVQERGLAGQFTIDSAGTHGYHIGDPPDSRAVDVALKKGISLDDLRARRFTGNDFHEFDYILAMDQGHHAHISALHEGQGKAALHLFAEFVGSNDSKDIPDPYYGSLKDFEYVLNLVEEGSHNFLEHLISHKGREGE
jgi:protein-tyrosine phosphatase